MKSKKKIIIKISVFICSFIIGVLLYKFITNKFYEYKAIRCNANSLISYKSNDYEINEAINIIKQELINDNEQPSEFYFSIKRLNKNVNEKDENNNIKDYDIEIFNDSEIIKNSRVTSLILFELWHESAFYLENQGLDGNPGGKCRNFYYEPKSKKVLEKLFWQ